MKYLILVLLLVIETAAPLAATPLADTPLAVVTPAHALQILTEVDEGVRQNFLDANLNGVDWKAQVGAARERLSHVNTADEMYRVLNTLLATLHTSHTAVYGPDDPFYYFIGTTFGAHAPGYEKIFGKAPLQWADPGFLVEKTDHGVFVESVLENDVASRGGLRVGDRILAVDGHPFVDSDFQRVVGQPVVLRVRRSAKGEPFTVSIIPHAINPQEAFITADRASARIIEQGGHKIGYVHLWAFSDARVYDVFDDLLRRKLKDAESIVIDLRDGIGGDYPRLLYPLLNGVPQVDFIARDGHVDTMGGPFRKPLVAIINGRARSAKELYAYALHRMGATLVGERTEGAVSAARAFFLSDGTLLYIAVAKVTIEGKSLEGVGVAPDIEVARPIPYAGGRDPQLDRALAVAVKRLAVSVRRPAIPARPWTAPIRGRT